MFFAKFVVIFSCYEIVSSYHFKRQDYYLDFLINDSEIVKLNGLKPKTEEYWIDQPVNHFDNNDTRTWKMRYFQNLQFWQPNGPIYVFICGEGKANSNFGYTGYLYELASETNGAIFITEHRYYGMSQPFKEQTTDNLKFLSSTQALADLKRFIDNIKLTPSSPHKSSKVVVVGGSYAGNLAAWMRQVYPSAVDAAISSSAPVLAKADFSEYIDTARIDYKSYGTPGCHDKIAAMFKRYDDLFQTEDGIQILKREENICAATDMHKLENQQIFLMSKGQSFMGAVQYGNVNKIQDRCRYMSLNFRQFLKTNKVYLWSNRQQCADYDFQRYIQGFKKFGRYYTWFYQTCTEFGYYQTSNSDNNYFMGHLPVDLFYKTCEGLFGPKFNKNRVEAGIAKTNAYHMGLKPNVTNVVFVNGELDPWHRLGITKDLSENAPARLIPLSSHCHDLAPSSPDDSKALKDVRMFTKNQIKKWISQ